MASRFWVGGTGTWDNSTTTNWAASTGGAGGQSVPASGDTVTIDASSGAGTITVAATINGTNTITSLTCGAMGMTLDLSANNPSLTMATFSSTGGGTRTINLGSGTLTLTNTANGTVFDITNTTNLTWNSNTSTLLVSAVSNNANRVLNLGGKTFNNITVTNAALDARIISFGQNFSVSNLAFTNVQNIQFAASATTTITGTFSVSNGGNIGGMTVIESAGGANATVTVSNATVLAWIIWQRITRSGGSSIISNSSIDGGSNSGVTINTPGGISRARAQGGF